MNKNDEPVGQEACATESTNGQGHRCDAAATSFPVDVPPEHRPRVPKTTTNNIAKENDNEFVRWPEQTNTVAPVGYTQAESARFQNMKPWQIYEYHEVRSDEVQPGSDGYRLQLFRNKEIPTQLQHGIPIRSFGPKNLSCWAN